MATTTKYVKAYTSQKDSKAALNAYSTFYQLIY